MISKFFIIDWSITDTDSGNVVKKSSIGGNKTQVYMVNTAIKTDIG
jgi:hypothetical protein